MAVNLLGPQYTYEYILADMLSRVPDTIDKREGGIIYDAIAPCAYKLAEAYLDTTEGEYLDRKGAEYGVARKQATYALREGTFTDSKGTLVDVPIGERFQISDITLVTETKTSQGVFTMRCEQVGSIGNAYNGIMLPLGNGISYVANAILGRTLIHGEDTETDNKYRERIKTSVINTESDGNVAQYLKWASQFDGVGATKIFPLAFGPNTVKVSITDSSNHKASSELIKTFQEYLDPEKQGLGNGKAPIGAKVTVVTGNELNINIKGKVVLQTGHSVVTGAEEAIKKYFSSITYKESRISYISVASMLLAVEGIAEVRELIINGAAADITLGNEDIPILVSLNLEVV